MPLTIYHNPQCSKSRKTLELIEEAGDSPRVIDYRATPPTAERIIELAARIGVPVRELLRTGEPEYRQANDLPDLDDDATLADWLTRHPKVIERPIVADDASGKAIIGRPPENVLRLLPR